MEYPEINILILVSTVTIVVLVIMTISLFLFFQKKKAQFLLEKKERETRYAEELSKAQREISEQTMQNIAWELHDNIGQLLSVIKLRLNLLPLPSNDETQGQVAEINEVVSTCLFEVRQLSRSLNQHYLRDIGLIEAIQIELDRFDKLKFLATKFKQEGEVVSIPPKDELILFRILQEFFSNVIKHARASKLSVCMQFVQDRLLIIAEDDGIGFDQTKLRLGSGIINMQSRAALIHADLDLSSVINQGVRLTIKYQVPKNHDHV